MKNDVGSTLYIILIVILSIAWFASVNNYDIVRTQRERIEILERTNNSSDPVILKQAELVRNDIERDYNNVSRQITTKEEESEIPKELSALFRLIGILLIAAMPIGFILAIVFALCNKFQIDREGIKPK